LLKTLNGKSQILYRFQSIKLDNIYTSVKILEKISNQRRLDIADLLKLYVSGEFGFPALGIFEQRVPGLEAVKQYSKLMVLGKPGSGKTTFLKHIAIKCSSGKFQAEQVPIFITLRDFAQAEQQPSLLKYITEQFADYGVADTTIVEQLLSQGRAIVLLDGLDEVLETDGERVLLQIRNFSEQFHLNHFVITCRIAAQEHTFEQFTEVEIADFDFEHIASFVTKWFLDKDPLQGDNFIKKLKHNRPIREIATNPLLLTLLCLVFEESADFPNNCSELYQEGIDILLKKWDAQRHVERDQVYKKLSVQHKDNLLSQIARITFERGEYFFRKEEVEQYIADYISNLPNVNLEPETLKLDSAAVLKSLEFQHGLLIERAQGIYSFSHLTFQEYFTAKEIVTNSNPKTLEQALNQLVSRITEKRWREVVLSTTSMLSKADYLLRLIKQQIDSLIDEDRDLQKFLSWLSQKSRAVNVTDKVVAVRAFYLDLSLGFDLKVNPTLSLAFKLDPTFALALKLGLELDLELDFALKLAHTLDYTLTRTLDLTLARIFRLCLEHELQYSLQQLKAQLPNPEQGEENLNEWWEAKGRAWVEQLRSAQIKYRNISHNWQFNVQQRKALQQYRDVNNLLVDCLKSASYMTQAVREEIETSMLLPCGDCVGYGNDSSKKVSFPLDLI